MLFRSITRGSDAVTINDNKADGFDKAGAVIGAVVPIVGGKVIGKALRDGAEGLGIAKHTDDVVFSADLTNTKAQTRSGHSYAGNKQLNDGMKADPEFRQQMETQIGADVYERTSTSNGGRRNPIGYEWDHNSTDKNKLDLRSKENHIQKTSSEPNRQGGWFNFWLDKK